MTANWSRSWAAPTARAAAQKACVFSKPSRAWASSMCSSQALRSRDLQNQEFHHQRPQIHGPRAGGSPAAPIFFLPDPKNLFFSDPGHRYRISRATSERFTTKIFPPKTPHRESSGKGPRDLRHYKMARMIHAEMELGHELRTRIDLRSFRA